MDVDTLVQNVELCIQTLAEELEKKYNVDESNVLGTWNKIVHNGIMAVKTQQHDDRLVVASEVPAISRSNSFVSTTHTPTSKPISSSSRSAASDTNTGKKKQCEFILTKGKNEGKQCPKNATVGYSFCSAHRKKKKKKPAAAKTNPNIRRLLRTTNHLAKRNEHGNYVHADTSFVFCPNSRKVIGKQIGAEVVPLSAAEIDVCKEYGFLFVIPEQFREDTDV